MDRLIENPINMRKKISLNVNTSVLDLVKELAKLTKTNNTLIIESLLVKGVSPLMKQFKEAWTAILCDTKDQSKKEHLRQLLKDLEKISKEKEFHPLIES